MRMKMSCCTAIAAAAKRGNSFFLPLSLHFCCIWYSSYLFLSWLICCCNSKNELWLAEAREQEDAWQVERKSWGMSVATICMIASKLPLRTYWDCLKKDLPSFGRLQKDICKNWCALAEIRKVLFQPYRFSYQGGCDALSQSGQHLLT